MYYFAVFIQCVLYEHCEIDECVSVSRPHMHRHTYHLIVSYYSASIKKIAFNLNYLYSTVLYIHFHLMNKFLLHSTLMYDTGQYCEVGSPR